MTNLLRWVVYSIAFGIILLPLMIHWGLTSVLEIFSISLTFGFFAGILNEILSELKSNNNRLHE